MIIGKAEAKITLDVDNLEDIECEIANLIAEKLKVQVDLKLQLAAED